MEKKETTLKKLEDLFKLCKKYNISEYQDSKVRYVFLPVLDQPPFEQFNPPASPFDEHN